MGKYYILVRNCALKLVVSNVEDRFEICSIIIDNNGYYNSTQVVINLINKING